MTRSAASHLTPPLSRVPPSPPLGGGEGWGEVGRARRLVLLAAALLLFALPLAACGKKGAPQPPADEPNTYPRTYPRE